VTRLGTIVAKAPFAHRRAVAWFKEILCIPDTILVCLINDSMSSLFVFFVFAKGLV
jgi:hypothetical protein